MNRHTYGTWFFIIALSLCSAYYSIVGMVALFPAILLDIIIACSVIESTKLWALHSLVIKWKYTPTALKIILITILSSLSLLTSIGVYGHLSKGHLEQHAPMEQSKIELVALQSKQTDLQHQLDALTQLEAKLNTVQIAQLSLDNKVSKNKDNLQTQLTEVQKKKENISSQLSEVNSNITNINKTVSTAELKLGPVKYFAELIGANPDNAVKFIMILIMVGLEPMIIILIIMASIQKSNDTNAIEIKNIADEQSHDPIKEESASNEEVQPIQELTLIDPDQPVRRKRGRPPKQKQIEVTNPPITFKQLKENAKNKQ